MKEILMDFQPSSPPHPRPLPPYTYFRPELCLSCNIIHISNQTDLLKVFFFFFSLLKYIAATVIAFSSCLAHIRLEKGLVCPTA